MFDPAELVILLEAEIAQRREEGCCVSSGARRLGRPRTRTLKQLQCEYDKLMSLEPPATMTRAEPSDLKAIRDCSPRHRWSPSTRLSDRRLQDRLRGAMLARCAGCMLGKPVELCTPDVLMDMLKKDGQFPLSNYFAESTVRRTRKFRHPFGYKYCTRGNFDRMERDDDIDYTVLGIHILETYGARFTTRHVADEWLKQLPYHQVYTAERAAYRNLIAAMPLEQVPTYRNPYREWIGAQIRADGLAYCTAGMPRLAAEFAHRDASLSHVKNGIYGEMLFAAMIAAAPYCQDIDEVIETGLAEIPAQCRLANAVREVVAWSRTNRDWTDTLEAIQERFGHYHCVHTINNAALVIMGLCHGKLDLGKTICITVMGGWDTDCTGATVGSIVGAVLGADRLPTRWIRPLHNRLHSIIAGYADVPITDVADRAFVMNRKLRAILG